MSKSVLAIHPLRSSTKMQEKNTCVELKYTNSTMSAHNSNEKKEQTNDSTTEMNGGMLFIVVYVAVLL